MEHNNLSPAEAEKIKKAAQIGVPLSITTYTFPREIEVYIDEVLSCFLEELNQEDLKDYLIYCINELGTNAKKANTKRVYFMESGLDINNPKDYELGMMSFKKDTLDNIDHYLKLQKEKGLYIKIILLAKNDNITVEIRNNSEMTRTEYMRVSDKIARSKEFSSLEDALVSMMDDTEGAGLGLVIMILMLKKAGLDGDSFEVLTEKGETVTRITVPVDFKTRELITVLSNDVLKYIDNLPQFPENIAEIQKLLNDPESTINSIAARISNDVALSADLLKLVNSAAFSLTKKCTNIADAVKLVGLRGIRNLLYSVGTMNLLGNSTDEQKKLWEHSYQTAYFAYNLARSRLRKRNVTEDAYVCGLMHDLGKIVFSLIHPDVQEKIENLKKERNMPDKAFQSLVSGIYHPEIGAVLAERWNFSESLVNSIRYHHAPEKAPPEFAELTATVALANLLTHYEEGAIDYYQIDQNLMDVFSIDSETELDNLCQMLQEGFSAEQAV
ncbi:HDOD domain-containing protein [Brucepastera parasyntrophica]|uniref:HDOD domain-containing protein n=1 Tax=Brucepastera parasyntrophica TaxID=2880008 RepID=UPI00210A3A71|nr:HDOD domain-containing protein [Brucepastera parasyntrophica]ULQ58977.1 HDOD domain-containing protein [Brucepastera parasyntrophica]